MVGAVDLAVAVGAATVEDEARLRRMRLRGVEGFVVALLAKPGLRDLQQLLVVRSVRVVAVQAAFHHGSVLPEERATLFRMTGVANLVHRVALQELGSGRTVRVVAIRAGQLSFPDRHVGGAHALGPTLRMALAAGGDLGRLGELTLIRDLFHELVAVDTAQVPGIVRTTLPVHAGRLLMALKAYGVLLPHWLRGRLSEADDSHALFAIGVYVS